MIQNVDKINEKNVKDTAKHLIADTLRKLKVLFVSDQAKVAEIECKEC